MRRVVKCPACGLKTIQAMGRIFSMTVRCSGCDSSLGVSRGSDTVSVVYTEVPVEVWKDQEAAS